MSLSMFGHETWLRATSFILATWEWAREAPPTLLPAVHSGRRRAFPTGFSLALLSTQWISLQTDALTAISS